MHFAQSSAAVHLCWFTAQLCEQQIFTGVLALVQAVSLLCEAALSSGRHFTQTSAAVHWYWVTSQLCAQHFCIGVLAVMQACCQPARTASGAHNGTYCCLCHCLANPVVLTHMSPTYLLATIQNVAGKCSGRLDVYRMELDICPPRPSWRQSGVLCQKTLHMNSSVRPF